MAKDVSDQIMRIISFGTLNKTQLRKELGNKITRPTLDKYLHDLESHGSIKIERQERDMIISNNAEEKASQSDDMITVFINLIRESWAEMLESFRKPHSDKKKQKTVNFSSKEYRYRLAQTANLMLKLFELHKMIVYLKTLAEMKKKSSWRLDESSRICVNLIRKIQADTICIDPKHEKQIVDFFYYTTTKEIMA